MEMTIATTTAPDFTTLSIGLLIARVMLGLGIAAHGGQKLFGWFGGHGLAGTGGHFESMGFRPGKLFAGLSGLGEVSGGLLVALGLFGPVGPALMIAVMLVAIATVHWPNGFFVANKGYEHPLLYAAGAASLAFTGFGVFSLDAVLGLELASPVLSVAAIVVGVVGALGAVAMRRTQAPPKTAAAHG
jgi:putative oxidoreductase